MREEIIYIGMINSKRGLINRLHQFWQGMIGYEGRHIGGDRARRR